MNRFSAIHSAVRTAAADNSDRSADLPTRPNRRRPGPPVSRKLFEMSNHRSGETSGHPLRRLTRWHSPLLVCLLLGMVGSLMAIAQDSHPATNAPNRMDFSSFKIITERNIFNPNRSARATRTGPSARDVAPPAKVDAFTLVGIMGYEKGWLAFFTGSSSQYNAVAKPGDTIGIFMIQSITPSAVQLATNGQPVELRVGMQMRREDNGPWKLQARAEPVAVERSRPNSGRSDSGSPTPPAAAPSAGENEILKRLMEKRAQELKK